MITKVSGISRKEAVKLDKNGKGGRWFGSFYSTFSGYTIPPLSSKEFKNTWYVLSNDQGRTKKKLKKLFGPQKYCVNGTAFRFWKWFFEYEDLTFSITCSVFGSHFRVYGKHNDDDVYDKIKHITNELTEKMK